MQQLRTTKYKLENSKTQKIGYFHIFKKNIAKNGSELIIGIIEDEKTGSLYEIPIADFFFVKVVPQKQSKKSTPIQNNPARTYAVDEHDDLPF